MQPTPEIASAAAPLRFGFLGDGADPPSKRAIATRAIELFVRDGVDAVTVRALADAAGYTNPVLFKYFGTKESLAQTLFDGCYLRLATRFGEAVRRGNSLMDNLESLAGIFVAVLDEEIEVFLYVQDNLQRFWPTASAEVRRRSLLAHLTLLLDEARTRGELPADSDREMVLATLGGLFAQVARQRYFGGFRRPREALRSALVAQMRGIVGGRPGMSISPDPVRR